MQIDVSFGAWLREQRDRRGWTLREVERLTRELSGLGLSNGHLSQIETGKRPPPTISPRVLFVLAVIYELDMLEMIERLGTYAGLQIFYERSGAVLKPIALPPQERH